MKNTLRRLALAVPTAAASLAATASTVLAIEVGDTKVAKGFAPDFGTLISGALQFIMAIAALAVFLYLVWGGIQWITSGGDKGKTEEARNKITAAVVGLIVLAASYAILQIMLRFLGLSSIQEAFKAVNPLSTGQAPL